MIRGLLEATPPPPDGGDIDELLAAFAAIAPRRQQLLDAATAGAMAPTDEDRAYEAALAARHAEWQHAFDDARRRLIEQRTGAGKLRRYAAVEAHGLER